MSARGLAIAAAFALSLSSAPAWAVYQCGGQVDTCQCGANNPYPCCDNGGNCTWWAWHAACCKWGVGLPGWGNANQWSGNANANGNYSVLSYPVTDAVSCRTVGTYGHVAFVTAVSGANISVTEENCWGNYGMRAANYSSTYFQGYITRKGATECRPGDSQTQGCGNCGTQSRGCGTSGKWGAWSGCSGQGPCAPGATQTAACGECGEQKRTCAGSCQWGAYQACAGPDPDGGTVACDSGKSGPCAPGILRCVGGALSCASTTAPSAEVCDSKDNDCDGKVDDGLTCSVDAVDAIAPAAWSPDPSSSEETSAASQTDSGAIGTCGSTGGGSAFGAALALALILARRRSSFRP